MSQTKPQNTTLADVIDMVVRYRWRLIVPAFLVMAVVLAGGLILPRKYKAEAMFERRTRLVMEQITAKGAPESMDVSRQTLIEEIAGATALDELIRSIEPQVAERIVRRTGGYDRVELRNRLRRDVLVTPVISTKSLDRINVSYVTEDAVVAQIVVNTLVQNYINRTRVYVAERLEETAAFFEKEVAQAKHEIEQLENQQLTFQLEHAPLVPDENGQVQQGMISLEMELAQARQKRDAARVRAQRLRERLAETPATIAMDVTAANPELKELAKKKRSLEDQAANYVALFGMTDRHPDMIALRAQIADLGRQIESTAGIVVMEQHLGANPKHRELDLMLTNAAAEAEALEQQTATLEARVAQLNADSGQLFPLLAEYRKLSRNIDEKQRQLTFWEDNLRRTRLTQAAESGQSGLLLDFVKPCVEVSKPVSPYLSQVLLAAVLLGLMAGGVGVFSAYRTDETFLGGEQVSREMGLPLFGSVSEIISRQQRRLRRLRNLIVYPTSALAMIVVLVALGGALYLSLERPLARPTAEPAAPAVNSGAVPSADARPDARRENLDV